MVIILKNLRESIITAVLAFILTIITALIAYLWIESIPFFLDVLILILVITIGIVADMIGIAAVAAEEESFHAKASKKVFGAKKGLFLVKNAHRVTIFMNDIVGDICGILSGSLGTIIILKTASNWHVPKSWLDLLALSLIAAITVGGKSLLKSYGFRKANEIILVIGKILASPTLLKRLFKNI